MAARLPMTILLLFCTMMGSAVAADDFYSEEYTKDLLRKLESEILGRASPLHPTDYLLIYALELKHGMGILNETVTNIGREYYDMWKQKMYDFGNINKGQQCNCNSENAEIEKLHNKVDAIQKDLQLVLEAVHTMKFVPTELNQALPPNKPFESDQRRPNKPYKGDGIPPNKPLERDEISPNKPLERDEMSPNKPHESDDIPPEKPYESDEIPPNKPYESDEIYGVETEKDKAKEALKNYGGRKQWDNVKKSLEHVLDPSSTAYKQLKAIDSQDTTPLRTLAYNGYTDLLGEMLDMGLPANALADDTWKYDLLSAAAMDGREDVARKLLEKGANTEHVNNRGVSALMFAAAKNNLPMVKLLVENGADVNRRSYDGNTALDLARKRHNKAVVDYLKAVTADRRKQ